MARPVFPGRHQSGWTSDGCSHPKTEFYGDCVANQWRGAFLRYHFDPKHISVWNQIHLWPRLHFNNDNGMEWKRAVPLHASVSDPTQCPQSGSCWCVLWGGTLTVNLLPPWFIIGFALLSQESLKSKAKVQCWAFRKFSKQSPVHGDSVRTSDWKEPSFLSHQLQSPAFTGNCSCMESPKWPLQLLTHKIRAQYSEC